MFSYAGCGLLTVIVSSGVMSVAWMVSKRSIADREKNSSFECGFDPIGSARSPFSMRFFLLAVIFLIFDVEIVLLFPFVTKMTMGVDLYMCCGLLVFLVILVLGLFHEWREGSLNWTD